MSTLMKLLDVFYSLQEAAREEEDYLGSHVYDVAVDLADGLSKGLPTSTWLPRLRLVLLENADKCVGAERDAYLLAVLAVDEHLAPGARDS